MKTKKLTDSYNFTLDHLTQEQSREEAAKGLLCQKFKDNPELVGRVTKVRIFTPDSVTPLAVGVATCVATDNFKKQTGRTLAFQRAVEQLKLPRPERAELWEAFNQIVNPSFLAK